MAANSKKIWIFPVLPLVPGRYKALNKYLDYNKQNIQGRTVTILASCFYEKGDSPSSTHKAGIGMLLE